MSKKYYLLIIALVFLIIGFFWLFKKDNYQIKNYPSSGTEIIAFGDSLVEGVGSTVGNDFVSLLSKKTGREIMNLGISGNTTEDGLKRIGEIEKYNPKVVMILLGGNDAIRRIKTETTFKNLELIIQKVHSTGAVVLLLGVKGGLLGDKFKPEFKEISQKYRTAFVPNVLDGLFGNPKFMSDGIHPNDEGYKIIAEKVYPVLISVLR